MFWHFFVLSALIFLVCMLLRQTSGIFNSQDVVPLVVLAPLTKLSLWISWQLYAPISSISSACLRSRRKEQIIKTVKKRVNWNSWRSRFQSLSPISQSYSRKKMAWIKISFPHARHNYLTPNTSTKLILPQQAQNGDPMRYGVSFEVFWVCLLGDSAKVLCRQISQNIGHISTKYFFFKKIKLIAVDFSNVTLFS